MAEGDPEVPFPLAWKRAFLALQGEIAAFQQQWLQWPLSFTPPQEEPWQGNVARLLVYHLTRSRELLWAEVNGGLDEGYQYEIDALNGPDENELEIEPSAPRHDPSNAGDR